MQLTSILIRHDDPLYKIGCIQNNTLKVTGVTSDYFNYSSLQLRE